MANRALIALALVLSATPFAQAQQDQSCVREFASHECLGCDPALRKPSTQATDGPRYADLESEHRLSGLASYYSGFFDGRKTANGEIYRNRKFSAAHLTLPLGCWIEVTARATGRRLRMRVNDRGPFVKKFVLDLSQAAARFLGVDVAADRHVDVHVIAMPGEEPPPEVADGVPGVVPPVRSAATAEQ